MTRRFGKIIYKRIKLCTDKIIPLDGIKVIDIDNDKMLYLNKMNGLGLLYRSQNGEINKYYIHEIHFSNKKIK